MIEIFDDERVVSKSKNLRGINERCRKVFASFVGVNAIAGNGTIFNVEFADGTYASTEFASYDLAVKYADSKRFHSARKSINPRK
jgi:hypothetical protein